MGIDSLSIEEVKRNEQRGEQRQIEKTRGKEVTKRRQKQKGSLCTVDSMEERACKTIQWYLSTEHMGVCPADRGTTPQTTLIKNLFPQQISPYSASESGQE